MRTHEQAQKALRNGIGQIKVQHVIDMGAFLHHEIEGIQYRVVVLVRDRIIHQSRPFICCSIEETCEEITRRLKRLGLDQDAIKKVLIFERFLPAEK